MKKRKTYKQFLAITSLLFLVGCDTPPDAVISTKGIKPIAVGERIILEFEYKINDESITSWKNLRTEIISGEDIIGLNGVEIIGLMPGEARLRIYNTAVYSNDFYDKDGREKVFTDEVEITVNKLN